MLHSCQERNERVRQRRVAVNSQVVKKYLAFYGAQKFTSVFIKACHCLLCWVRRINFTVPYLVSFRLILILSTKSRPARMASSVLLSGFQTKVLYAFLFSLILYFPYSAENSTNSKINYY